MNINDVGIDTRSKDDILKDLTSWLSGNKSHFVVTANPEFITHAIHDEEFYHAARCADMRTADGAGLLWAATLQRINKSKKQKNNLILKIIKSLKLFALAAWGLVALVVYPKYNRSVIKERTSGVDLVSELLKFCEKNKKRVYFLGSTDAVLEKLENKLDQMFPQLEHKTSRGLETKYEHLKEKEASKLLQDDINNFEPHLLLVAFGMPRQEKWIYSNLRAHPSVRLAMGVGGTFDFYAEIKKRAPQFMRTINLEWLWRLFHIHDAQHIGRVFNATVRFIFLTLRAQLRTIWELLRPNVVGVVFRRGPNRSYEVFVAKRFDQSDHWQFPQGGIENGESFEEAVRRELSEEIGLSELKFLGTSKQSHSYTWKEPHFLGYIGQRQTICYCLIEGEFDPRLNHDFIEYKWVPIERLLEMLHPVRRGVGEIVLNDFTSRNLNFKL